MSAYADFLKAKIAIERAHGLACDPWDINTKLFPHQQDIVRWAVQGGQRAIFADFGLGKTFMQLEICRLISEKSDTPSLIVAPLGVRGEFKRDAESLGTPLTFIREIGECHPWKQAIYLTNYETIRDGKLDPKKFGCISLDEASVLRGFGGTKTFREFMRHFEGSQAYRFVATATPSPNEYIELLSYAAFLGVMDVGQAKTRFFKRDSTKADKLTLHAHKEREFWLWVSSWAIFLQKPSDLGYSDEGYSLPEMKINWHEIPSDHANAGHETSGQGKLLRNAALGVSDASREKRDSLDARIEKLVELRAIDLHAHRIIWHDLESERAAIESLSKAQTPKGCPPKEGDGTGLADSPICPDCNHTHEEISVCAAPYREGNTSHYCSCVRLPQAMPPIATVYGSQDMEEREQIIADFSDGKIAELATKPRIAGSGCNFQRHCAWAIFLGIGFKFNDFIQAIHRIYRFLQTKPVRIDLIYTEAEREVRRTLERKWEQHNAQRAVMTEIIRKYGLGRASIAKELQRSIGVKRREAKGASYTIVNNDSVLECETLPDASAHLILTSIPFSTQYEYTPSYNDFGHSDSNEHFFQQMDFLTPHLFRVLQPGRVAAIHVKDRIVPGGMTNLGFQTVYPFHADCIAHYRKHGFAFLGMKTIVTDVVRENNQTYRLGWTEQCKDGSRMGFGMPEYLLLFRKPPTDTSNGYADVPVEKSKQEYSRSRWQIDAHGFARSGGDRLLTSQELCVLPHERIFKWFRGHSLSNVYDFEQHVALSETLERCPDCGHIHTGQKVCGRILSVSHPACDFPLPEGVTSIEITRRDDGNGQISCTCPKPGGRLPVTFMLLQPQSWHPDVWTDITRMLSLNSSQSAHGREMHLCPMQFDLADRVIAQFTMRGETVLDPFGGLMTVPYRAIKLGRKAIGIELAPGYFADGVAYCEAAEKQIEIPTLFDLGMEAEEVEEAKEVEEKAVQP